MSIYLDYNGSPVTGDDLCWFGLRECGCCAHSAQLVSIHGRPLCITAEDACLISNGGSKRAANKDKREYVLGLRSEITERLTMTCPQQDGAA